MRLLFGRPIPPTRPLSKETEHFVLACLARRGRVAPHFAEAVHRWKLSVRVLHEQQELEAAATDRNANKARCKATWRQEEARAARKRRRLWWEACRSIRAQMAPYIARRPPHPAPIQWAIEAGVVELPN